MASTNELMLDIAKRQTDCQTLIKIYYYHLLKSFPTPSTLLLTAHGRREDEVAEGEEEREGLTWRGWWAHHSSPWEPCNVVGDATGHAAGEGGK